VLQLPLLTFGLVAPLGIIGIFLTRERWRGLWLLYGGVLAYLLAALIFYVLARYRLPVVPFLLPFAGAGIVEIGILARKKRFLELFLVFAALITLYFFTNYEVASDTPHGASSGLTRIGNAYLAQGEKERAIEAYREAIAADPGNREARAALEAIVP
jgi:tetratricopeptide (TPR) repeat protein